MAHLGKSFATGHLLKMSAGHLSFGCGGGDPPDGEGVPCSDDDAASIAARWSGVWTYQYADTDNIGTPAPGEDSKGGAAVRWTIRIYPDGSITAEQVGAENWPNAVLTGNLIVEGDPLQTRIQMSVDNGAEIVGAWEAFYGYPPGTGNADDIASNIFKDDGFLVSNCPTNWELLVFAGTYLCRNTGCDTSGGV